MGGMLPPRSPANGPPKDGQPGGKDGNGGNKPNGGPGQITDGSPRNQPTPANNSGGPGGAPTPVPGAQPVGGGNPQPMLVGPNMAEPSSSSMAGGPMASLMPDLNPNLFGDFGGMDEFVDFPNMFPREGDAIFGEWLNHSDELTNVLPMDSIK